MWYSTGSGWNELFLVSDHLLKREKFFYSLQSLTVSKRDYWLCFFLFSRDWIINELVFILQSTRKVKSYSSKLKLRGNWPPERLANFYSVLWKENIWSLSRGVRWGGGGGLTKRLMGMWRWIGSHFHNWSDYNGVAFSIELREWGRKFSDFGGK